MENIIAGYFNNNDQIEIQVVTGLCYSGSVIVTNPSVVILNVHGEGSVTISIPHIVTVRPKK